MDRFAEIRAFVAVADASGFAAAARETGHSRSAVNRLVISLEERLGVQLLNRSTRQVSMTSAGKAFYERARQILDDLEEAEAAVSSIHEEAIGLLRIGAPLTFGRLNLSKVVADFMVQHPRVEVELNLETRWVDVVAEGYDLVVRVSEPDEDTCLVDHRILPIEYFACAAPSYLERAGTPEHPLELKEHALLCYNTIARTRYWHFIGPEGAINVPANSILQSNNLEPLLDAALAGLGITVLPAFSIDEHLQRGELTRILPGYELPKRMLQVIYPPARHLSAKVRLFTDFLSERFAGPSI